MMMKRSSDTLNSPMRPNPLQLPYEVSHDLLYNLYINVVLYKLITVGYFNKNQYIPI